MDQTKIQQKQPAPAEIHTSVEDTRRVEELARAERMLDPKAEQHAHHEAKLVKQELENKSAMGEQK
ncbi:10757_t:CDS:2 [Ambispora gerdemannii]|uniref:10757_t:CDS:1 n=1 Tax=Ambispora gerdemannii TaxID=144530 RepID=A0A9N9ADQ3_9GLOM|nr:10757_t:CDS:2 [Ambispora gerdemannii]